MSAMLLISPMLPQGLHIQITSEKTDGSYIRITRNMMENWGVQTQFDGKNYEVMPGPAYHKTTYVVEPVIFMVRQRSPEEKLSSKMCIWTTRREIKNS